MAKVRQRMRTVAAIAFSTTIYAGLFGWPARAQETVFEGQPVAQIQVLDVNLNPVAEKVPTLALKEGASFDFPAERESLRTLYATGDYANIRVAATRAANGLHVDFIVTRDFYNNVIRIDGLKEPPTEPAAQSALRLNLGEPFRESAVKDGVQRLEDTLHEEGLFEAKVTYDLAPHPDTRQMDVNVHVSPGPRARLGAVTVQNQTPDQTAQLLKKSKIVGKKAELTSQRLTRGTDRLRAFLVNQGYLGATAQATVGTYDAASNQVPVTLAVTAGPRVQIEVNGARLSKGNLRKLLPIYSERAVDEDLLQEGRRNIRDYFQRQGFFNADVQVTSRQTDGKDERSIVYQINRGERYRLMAIAFNGNRYFTRSLLVDRLQLQTASFASYGRFSQQLMRVDTDAIQNLYQSNGFRNVEVTSDVQDKSNGKKNNLFVTFNISEGDQTRIAGLQIDGNTSVKTDDLLSVIGSTENQPYSEAGVASDRNNVLAYYYNDGFPEARFQEEVVNDSEANRVRLVYHITEGPRIEVAQVLLTGYQYTRPGIISRQVEVKAKGPLREGDVADSQRQLYNLGVFNRVQIAQQNPDGTDPDKTVVVDVREGNRYTIGYGAGFEVQRIAGGSSNPNGTILSSSPRGIFEISRANMFGRAQTLTFRGRASTLEYRAALTFSADNFLTDRKLSLQLTGYAEKSQDVNTFTSIRFEGSAQLVEKLSTSSSLLYRYFYRRVKAENINGTINPEQIPLYSQPTLVSGLGITYARDRRDNPADATRGNFNTIDISDAIKGIGSSADFLRLYVQNSSFYSFGRAFVFARSTRFGYEQPLGGTVAPDDPSCLVSCNTIPLPERFFAGGGSSLRGFGLNQAGPRDPVTGFPVGGLALLAFNQELRFPMKLPFIGNRLGGTLFYDGGNVYSDVNHITMRWKSPSTTDLNYFSHTIGFGVRYPTPVGPVRIDIGYQLNPAHYQSEDTTTMPPTIHTFQVPHIGFFFNIGPIF
jgi:outer membrane protein insertion porin family